MRYNHFGLMISASGENLVFLLSTPRSGSTLLGALLGSHSAIASPPEPWFLLRLAAVYAPATHVGWFDDRLAAAATRDFLTPEGFRESARQFAAAAYNRQLAAAGRRLLVDKTPRYYHILHFLDEMFPDARQIWLQRNPFAVAASFKKAWNLPIDVFTGRQLSAHSFDLALALRCLSRHFRGGPRQHEIQYEQLVRQPRAEVERLCAFLGLSFEERMLDYASNTALLEQYRHSAFGDRSLLGRRTIDSDTVDAWREVLSHDEIEQVATMLGKTVFERMGYAQSWADVNPSRPSETSADERQPDQPLLAQDVSPAEPDQSDTREVQSLLADLEGHALAAGLVTATADRDRWQRAAAELEGNRNYFQQAYDIMVTDRDRWREALHDLETQRDSLQQAYETMLADRDRWQTAANELQANRDDYQRSYEAVLADRDRWQTAANELQANRDDYQRSYEAVLTDRDRWQTAANELQANRDDYQRSYEAMLADRDRWQTAANELQANRDDYQRSYEAVLADRDRLQAACSDLEARCDEYKQAYESLRRAGILGRIRHRLGRS